MIDVTDNNAVYYYHHDGLGSIAAISNINETVIDESSVVGNPFMFTGRRFDDETGNYYYRARYYEPKIERFLQPGGLSLRKISVELSVDIVIIRL